MIFSTFRNKFESLGEKAQPEGVFWENEVQANRLNAFIMLICMVVLGVATLLNVIGVFETGERMVRVGLQGLVELAVPVALCYHFKGERWWLKYLLILMMLFACARLQAVLSYNVPYIMTVPVIMASRYFQVQFTQVVGALTLVLQLVADIASFSIGSVDMNVYPSLPVGTQITVETTTKQAILDHGVPLGEIIPRYLRIAFLPRAFILLVIIAVLALIARHGRRMVEMHAGTVSSRVALETELATAMEIQMGMMPSLFPGFSNAPEFDLFAEMLPAKEVGGDFYDFFLIDDDHMALVIADVSGKGIPAALFMMASKILISEHLMSGDSPAEVLRSANESICTNNEAEMFVTVWIGILEISTGKLVAANAGHEYPAIKRPGHEFELFRDKHGFVVGSLQGMSYTDYELTLEPGTKLYVYTDGVPESTDADKKLYGTDRMLAALNANRDEDTETIIGGVYDDINTFVGGAPQFDDVTMLCLEYRGPRDSSQGAEEESLVKEMTVEATVENIETVTEFVNRELEALDCPPKAQTQIDIAIDELFGNIARYAYESHVGPATVRVEVDDEPMSVIITFIDHGVPFDPLAADEPDITLGVEDRPIGGLGLFLVRQTMDDVKYEYKDGQNILSIKKHM